MKRCEEVGLAIKKYLNKKDCNIKKVSYDCGTESFIATADNNYYIGDVKFHRDDDGEIKIHYINYTTKERKK